MPDHVQTRTEIAATLRRFGVRPRKRHGQHFLTDGNLMRRLADAAELTAEDTVLEVGPGTGGLTDLLVARCGRVVAVEIDPVMRRILGERFAGEDRLEVVGTDVLANRNRLACEVREALRNLTPAQRPNLKLVANLPYNVAAPLLVNLLVGDPAPVRYCFTIQKELADRFLAAPRTKDYGPLSVVFQALCEIERLAGVPPSAFYPKPRVTSTMLRMTPSHEPLYREETPGHFLGRVRGAFKSRRKTLRHNLRKVLGPGPTARLEEQFDLDRRAEELDVAEWVALDSAIGELAGT